MSLVSCNMIWILIQSQRACYSLYQWKGTKIASVLCRIMPAKPGNKYLCRSGFECELGGGIKLSSSEDSGGRYLHFAGSVMLIIAGHLEWPLVAVCLHICQGVGSHLFLQAKLISACCSPQRLSTKSKKKSGNGITNRIFRGNSPARIAHHSIKLRAQ